MDPAQLEELYQQERIQHTGRKTSRLPPRLTGSEGELSEAQLLVRRGQDGLYIDACMTEDMLERAYAETFPRGYEYQESEDKVRLIIRQREEEAKEDEDETLVDDTEQIQEDIVPDSLDHPWWERLFDPEQEDLTDKQARWLFRFLLLIFFASAIGICGVWRFLLSLGVCLVTYLQLNNFVWKQNYNWQRIDLEELRRQNPKVWIEYIRWGLTGARELWNARREWM
jgi:hypothetical protein